MHAGHALVDGDGLVRSTEGFDAVGTPRGPPSRVKLLGSNDTLQVETGMRHTLVDGTGRKRDLAEVSRLHNPTWERPTAGFVGTRRTPPTGKSLRGAPVQTTGNLGSSHSAIHPQNPNHPLSLTVRHCHGSQQPHHQSREFVGQQDCRQRHKVDCCLGVAVSCGVHGPAGCHGPTRTRHATSPPPSRRRSQHLHGVSIPSSSRDSTSCSFDNQRGHRHSHHFLRGHCPGEPPQPRLPPSLLHHLRHGQR